MPTVRRLFKPTAELSGSCGDCALHDRGGLKTTTNQRTFASGAFHSTLAICG
jgi:hypothetical protein